MEVTIHVPAIVLIAVAPFTWGGGGGKELHRMEQVPRGSLQLQRSTHGVSAYNRPLPNLYVFTIYNHLPISCDEANVPNCKAIIIDK